MKIQSIKRLCQVSLPVLLSVSLASCGGNGGSTSGADASAEAPATAPIGAAAIGPNLNGSNWSGILKSERDGAVGITANIVHEGNKLTIVTTAIGIGHKLSGTISPAGTLRLIDTFNGEDWSSEAGNASKNSINVTDYVADDRGVIVDRYDIFLKR